MLFLPQRLCIRVHYTRIHLVVVVLISSLYQETQLVHTVIAYKDKVRMQMLGLCSFRSDRYFKSQTANRNCSEIRAFPLKITCFMNFQTVSCGIQITPLSYFLSQRSRSKRGFIFPTQSQYLLFCITYSQIILKGEFMQKSNVDSWVFMMWANF